LIKIAKYGYDVVLVVSIITFLVIISSFFIKLNFVRIIIDLFFILFFLFTLFFFRDPDRKTPIGNKNIISPADGEICEIKDIVNDKYLESPGKQVSIFMSPLNVHVNRNPVDGKIIFKKEIPGEFFIASEDKASEKNEQTIIIIENSKTKILVKQIAGFIARRIVNTINVGDQVTKGERFGMIKFGSRVDLLLPITTEIKVNIGDKVIGGETIIGQLVE